MLLFYSQQSNAQRDKIGLHFSGYKFAETKVAPLFGFTYDRQFANNFGLETDLFFYTKKENFSMLIEDKIINGVVVKKYYTNLPVLFKYHSRIVDFGIGPSFHIFTKWKQTSENNNAKIESVKESPAIRTGYLLKASKSFNITEQIFLEPEIYFGAPQFFKNEYYGLGINLKYGLK